MMADHIQTAIWDIETDNLLYKMTRVHCLVIRDFERKVTHRFRRNDVEDTIDEGIDMLEDAALTIGHNSLSFDVPALSVAYDGVCLRGQMRDTLAMSRMVFADQKDKDFRLFEKGKLPGALIGAHTLEAWGYRLGLHKGDYKKDMEAKGLDPWASWNQDLEDYCVNDVEVTTLLWEKIRRENWAAGATVLEHSIHDLMGQQQRNGINFDVPAAQKLALELSTKGEELSKQAIDHYGSWWAPAKKRVVKAMWDDPEGINKAKKYDAPRPEFGEDLSRAVWADVVVPKKTLVFKDPLRADRWEGAAYCPVELKEFNPNSRPQIVDRFVTVHNWNPVDFTETGRPEVSDTVLRTLAADIPMAETLAELFFYKKILGQVATGPQAWLKQVTPEGKIHSYTNVGGTVSGRCSHVGPNLAQVPSVMVDKEKRVLLGREGEYGWECRSLFYVPEGWTLTGIDLSGIELRCLGEALSQWDNGAYLEIVLNGDVHSHNQALAELPTRSMAKTFIYACVPMDTLALTKEGWKSYEQLQVGEPILTYNQSKHCKEWKPVLEKVRYSDAEVVELKNDQTFSVRCTPNHRWFVRRRTSNRNRRWYVNEVRTAEELNTECEIIVNAPMCEDVGSGLITAHEEIKYGTDWPKQILAMSQNERRAWLSGFLVADGHMNPDTGLWCWVQNCGSVCDAAMIASYLCWNGRITFSDKTSVNSAAMTGRATKRDYVTCQKIRHIPQPRQDVWCVRTENESWVMRQGNTITITGNTIYGGGDVKLGSIVEPLASEDEQREIGIKLRARFMDSLPAFKMLLKQIKTWAKRGALPGLDGRKLYARSPHSALNLKLQSDAALIAKKWTILIEEGLQDEGLIHGWEQDFVHLLFIHDENQIASRGHAETVERVAIKAAADAGKFFGYKCPIGAEAKSGLTWASTH